MTDVLVDQPRYVLEGGELDTVDFADIGTCTLVDWAGEQLLVSFVETLSAAQIDEVTARAQAPYIPPVAAPPPPVEPPTVSPTFTATGGVRSITIQLTPATNPSPFKAKIYVGTANPLPLVDTDPGKTLHGLAEGTMYEVFDLPDGTPLVDLPAGTLVQIAVAASNSEGDATPSPQASASLQPLDDTDFAVDHLYAFQLDVSGLTGGTFNLGTGTVDTVEAVAVTGAKVGMSIVDNRGIYSYGAPEVPGEQGPVRIWFPIDAKPNIVSGQSEFDDATINRTMTLNGTTTLTPGSRFVLGSGVQAPKTAPSVVPNWHTVQHSGSPLPGQGYIYAGLTVGHDGNWWTVGYHTTFTSLAEAFDATGARVKWTGTGGLASLDSNYAYSGGIVYASHNGGRYYLLAQKTADKSWHIEARDTTFALLKRTQITPGFRKLPALGWDHVNTRLLVANVDTNTIGQVNLGAYTVAADGTPTFVVASSLSTPGGYSHDFDIAYIARVTTESGDRYVFRGVPIAADNFQVFTTAAVHQTSEEWPVANSTGVRGGWYDGTRFWSMDGQNRRCRYETGRAMWTSGSATREIESTLWTGTRAVSATRTSGSPTLTGTGVFLPSDVGMPISGTGIPSGATVLAYTDANTVTLSANASSSGTSNVTLTRARTVSATTTNASAVVTSTSDVFLSTDVGKPISGVGIPAGATVLSYQNTKQVTLSANATASGLTSVTISGLTYETNPSPKFSVTMPKRARMTVTVGAIPLGAGDWANALAARVYSGVGSGVANGSMNLEKTIIAPGTAWSLDSTVAQESATTHPPTGSGTFPASTPSQLETALGGFLLKANGDGDPGTGTFRDGIRTAARDTPVIGCRYYRTGAQSIPTGGTGTQVAFGTLDYDSQPSAARMANAGTDAFTVPAGLGGQWDIDVRVTFAGNATGRRGLGITLNTTTYTVDGNSLGGDSRPPAAAGPVTLRDRFRTTLAAGDTIRAWAYQNSGGALNLSPGPYGPVSIEMVRVGPTPVSGA